jgi:murein DD-endopeptidase MepM/ murein hydrolase activator NlpD
MPENNNRNSYWENLFKKSMPHGHLIAAGAVAISIIVLLSLVPSDKVEANRQIHRIALSDSVLNDQQPANNQHMSSSQSPAKSVDQLAIANDSQGDPAPTHLQQQQPQSTTVISGDNLTTIFRRMGLGIKDAYEVANAQAQASKLKRLKPGETVAISLDNNGKLNEVKYSRSKLEHYFYRRVGNRFDGEQVLYEPTLVTAHSQSKIQNSFFLDANRAGLSDGKIMELANIFGWDIDFALDIRDGDHFSVLYEEKYLAGQKVGYGDILAATFSNQGRVYKAVRFLEADGRKNYFSPDGKAMRKAFLRAPLDFTRISSNFNLRRKHPIHKKVKAHRGVDYAAPRHTPVYAAGDGKVIASGYSNANGNYVFLQHGQKFVTKYLHLNKRRVRKGQTVQQRQTIGTVGSTGYATGPHLHYEFLANGVHRNPRTVDLPGAKPVVLSSKAEFLKQTTPMLARLDQLSSTQIALNTTTP